MSSKASVRAIVRAHRASYRNATTGRRMILGQLLFEGLPTVVFALLLVFDVKLTPEASVGLLTISGLLSAFLFAVMLQIADRAMSWSDDMPQPGKATSEHAEFLRELAANAGYASLVSIAAAAVFVVASVSTHHQSLLRVTTALGLALGVHLMIVLLMVMKRVFALTEQRLNRARVGAGRDDRPAPMTRVK